MAASGSNTLCRVERRCLGGRPRTAFGATNKPVALVARSSNNNNDGDDGDAKTASAPLAPVAVPGRRNGQRDKGGKDKQGRRDQGGFNEEDGGVVHGNGAPIAERMLHQRGIAGGAELFASRLSRRSRCHTADPRATVAAKRGNRPKSTFST